MVVLAVLTVQRYAPSCEISTQQGAVWRSAKGEEPIELNAPAFVTLNAETEPLPAPPCAFEMYRCEGLAGENSLPKGPAAWAGNGEPAAGVSSPSDPTTKLSTRNVLATVVPTSTPMRLVPVELKRMSPGFAVAGRLSVDPGNGTRWPPGLSVNPV